MDTCNNFFLRGGCSYLVIGKSGSSKSRTVMHLIENWGTVTNNKETIGDIHIW